MVEPKKVEYPINYKKPNLLNYIVDYIFDCSSVERWDTLDLGEWVVEDIVESDTCFELSDSEYAMLCTAMDNFIKDKMSDAIEQEIADRVESAKEWREAKDSAIYE